METLSADINPTAAYLAEAFKTGQTVELHTPAHPYWNARLDIMDSASIVRAETIRYRIARVTKRGDDIRLTLRDGHNLAHGGYSCGGCSIMVRAWLAHGPKGHPWRRVIRHVAGS